MREHEKLKEARTLSNLTISDVSELSCIPEKLLKKYEAGQVHPSKNNRVILAHIFNVKPEDLQGDTEGELTVGEKLRKYRLKNKLSMRALSSLSGIPIQTISSYEVGLMTPRPSRIKIFADALNVSVQDLSGEDMSVKTLGEKFRKIRTCRELTKKELSALSGLPISTIYTIETSEHMSPITRYNAGKLAEYFGTTLDEMEGVHNNTHAVLSTSLVRTNIRKFREELNMSVRDLSASSGISCYMIERYEVGKSKPSKKALQTLAAVFQVDVWTLQGEQKELLDSMKTGERIRILRERRGFSRAKLASLSGASEGAIITWEHGRCRPSAPYITAVANALNVSEEKIIGVDGIGRSNASTPKVTTDSVVKADASDDVKAALVALIAMDKDKRNEVIACLEAVATLKGILS